MKLLTWHKRPLGRLLALVQILLLAPFPTGTHASDVVLCIEPGGVLKVDVSGGVQCCVRPEHPDVSVRENVDSVHLTDSTPEGCGSCVDILLPHGGDTCISPVIAPRVEVSIPLELTSVSATGLCGNLPDQTLQFGQRSYRSDWNNLFPETLHLRHTTVLLI